DAAILLLGYMCVASPAELASLRFNDIEWINNRLRVRITRLYNNNRARQYISIPMYRRAEQCPVRAILAWRTHLSRLNYRTGPFFVRFSYADDDLRISNRPMRPLGIASFLNKLVESSGLQSSYIDAQTKMTTHIHDIEMP